MSNKSQGKRGKEVSDYIKREDALKPEIELLPDVSGLKTNQYESFLVEQVIQIYKNYLKNLPAADVVERKQGKWIEYGEPNERGEYELWYCHCDQCGAVGLQEYNFCYNCGAEMESADDV